MTKTLCLRSVCFCSFSISNRRQTRLLVRTSVQVVFPSFPCLFGFYLLPSALHKKTFQEQKQESSCPVEESWVPFSSVSDIRQMEFTFLSLSPSLLPSLPLSLSENSSQKSSCMIYNLYKTKQLTLKMWNSYKPGWGVSRFRYPPCGLVGCPPSA